MFLFFKAFIGRPNEAVVDFVSINLYNGLVVSLISTVNILFKPNTVETKYNKWSFSQK